MLNEDKQDLTKKTYKMKNIITLLYNKFKHYFLIFLGFIYILIYIYFNFIRERLPRDLPFNLTELKFYSLCIICIMYVYVIYRTFYPKALSIIIVYLLSLITKPILLLLQHLTKVRVISKIYTRSWLHLIPILDECSLKTNIKFIYLLTIVPRVILLIIFIIDIFYFNKISIFYYLIFLGLLPLIYILLIKYLENIMEDCIQILDDLYTKVYVYDERSEHLDYEQNPNAIHHDSNVTIRKYIDIQYEAYVDKEYIEYKGDPLPKYAQCLAHEKNLNKKFKDMTTEELFMLDNEFNFIMPKILVLKVFLDVNTKNANKYAYISEIKIIILIMYLICWLYILIISYPTLKSLVYTIKY